jgi:hypothetical protein
MLEGHSCSTHVTILRMDRTMRMEGKTQTPAQTQASGIISSLENSGIGASQCRGGGKKEKELLVISVWRLRDSELQSDL